MSAAVVGMWGFTALYMSAGDRTEVVVAAADVGRFEVIESGDLRTARVAVEPGVDTIAADEADDLVGRVTATELVEGSLLSPDQLVDEGERLVGPGEVLVGARLAIGEVPTAGVEAGSQVLVVVRPAETATAGGQVEQVQGWLLELGDPDPNSGERAATVVVPRTAAANVTAAAADDRLSVVVLEG